MQNNKGLGAVLERLEKKNQLLFRNFYSAVVLEYSFLVVILMFWVLHKVTGGFSALNTATQWFTLFEAVISCLVLPLILGIMHFRACRKDKNYIFFKSLGWMLAACMPLTLLVSTLNDLIGNLLFKGVPSVSPEMMFYLLAACGLLTVFIALVFQTILIFIRARNE